MEFKGASVYDERDFFANYMNRRNRQDSPNNAIEGPIIFELLGDIQDKRILDLGCGDASFGKELLQLGAKQYIGIEGSRQMAEAARETLQGKQGTIYVETVESFQYPIDSFEIVTSRFAIHYVENLQMLFQHIYHSLIENGKFVFSVQHPLTTASFVSKESGERKENWIVDDYFREGERKEPWINQIVVKYHRTIEHYFMALRNAGFNIIDLREGTPKREHFSSEEEFVRRQRIPVVLAFSCVKQGTA